jgi:hypothetical protein
MARMPILWKLASPIAKRPFAPLVGGPVLPGVLSGARALIPTDLSPLFAWWYGKDDASIDTSSSNVWTDHAGVGPALTQSTSGFRGTESVGSGVSFDSDDVLNVAGAPNGGWDAVAAFTANSDNSTWRTLFWDQSVMHACLLEAGTNRLGCYNNAFVDSGLTITPGQKVVLVVRMDASGNVSMSLNGGAFTGTITTFTAGNRQINSIGSSSAGAQPVGTVHDISLYSGNLSSTDTDKAVGSRAWDWGTQADLAGGHSYASAPPMVGTPTTQTGSTGECDETDTAFALGAAMGLGLSTEANTALALGGKQILAAGLSSESDSSLALAAKAIRAVGLATETDTALALGSARPPGLATETDTAVGLSGKQIRAVGLCTETDTALALTPGGGGMVGLSTETDSAFALTGKQIRGVGLAIETETGLALSGVQRRATGLSTETETALALTPVALRAVARFEEAWMIYWPPKAPGAVLDYTFDFTAFLQAGETISSKTVSGAGVTVDSSAIVGGNQGPGLALGRRARHAGRRQLLDRHQPGRGPSPRPRSCRSARSRSAWTWPSARSAPKARRPTTIICSS